MAALASSNLCKVHSKKYQINILFKYWKPFFFNTDVKCQWKTLRHIQRKRKFKFLPQDGTEKIILNLIRNVDLETTIEL